MECSGSIFVIIRLYCKNRLELVGYFVEHLAGSGGRVGYTLCNLGEMVQE